MLSFKFNVITASLKGWAWWSVFAILALWRLSEEDGEFRAGICYRVSHYLKRNNMKQIHLDHLGACTCFYQLDTTGVILGDKKKLRKYLLKIVGKSVGHFIG